jgi:hypothetical protein
MAELALEGVDLVQVKLVLAGVEQLEASGAEPESDELQLAEAAGLNRAPEQQSESAISSLRQLTVSTYVLRQV